MNAVIWDFNGVIIDDEHLHADAFAKILGGFGFELSRSTYFARYLGLDDWGFFRRALQDFRHAAPDDDEVDDLVEKKAGVYLDLLGDDIVLVPGADALVRSLAEHVPLGVASGARRHEIEAVLERSRLRDKFMVVVSADEVENGKPNPEGYLRAFSAIQAKYPNLEASACLVIEDAPHGVQAAHAAGMKAIAVATSRRIVDLHEADYAVHSLTELDHEQIRRRFWL